MDGQSNKKQRIRNPVLTQPWRKQTKSFDNPRALLRDKERRRRVPTPKVERKGKSKREKNLECLMMRFPELKKRIAKASLTLSNNILDLAVLHIELKYGLQKKFTLEGTNVGYLKDFELNVSYGPRANIVLRNVAYESSLTACNSLEDSTDPESSDVNLSFGEDSDSDSNNPNVRVGVVIRKTRHGYRAIPFERNL